MTTKTKDAWERDTGRSLCRAMTGATELSLSPSSAEGRLTTAEVKAWEEAPRVISMCMLEGAVPTMIAGWTLWGMMAGPGSEQSLRRFDKV